MSEQKAYDYIYLVEWDDSVHRPPYAVMHEILLDQGADRSEFERYMAQEGFAQGAEVRTRAGALAAQYLLEPVQPGPPTRMEALDVELPQTSCRLSMRKFRVVASWHAGEEE